MPTDVTQIQRWTEQLDARWSPTHERWDLWESMVKRMLRPVVDPKMGNVGAGADYRTADLLKELKRIIAFMSTATWDFEGKPGKASPTGRDEAKNAELWFRAWWAQVNKGGWLNEVFAAGQALPGVTTVRLLMRNLMEPEEGVDRDEWMQSREGVWYFRDVPTTTVQWDPINDAYNRIVMDYELSYTEAREDYKVDGADLGEGYDAGKLYVPIHDTVNAKVGWAGDDRDVDSGEQSDTSRKLHVTVIEYRSTEHPCPICPDAHPLWVGAEYVRDSSVKKLQDEQKVREYVLPYKNWPTLRICEGETWPSQTDPLWRYTCMMYDLLINAEALNWIDAMLLAVANRDMTQGDLIQLNNTIPDSATQVLDGLSMQIPPNTVDDKADLLPGQPVRWPPHLTGELMSLREVIALRFERSKVNPVLFGEAFDEARQAPGTTFALLLRQARAPFDRPLKKQAQFELDVVEDVEHAILFMDHEEDRETEQRYYTNLMGEEGGEPGEKVYLSASKLSTHPKIYIKPNAEQLAESQARHEAEYQDYLRNWISADQVLEGMGYKDTAAQKILLEEDRQRRLAAPMLDNARMNYFLQISADSMDTEPTLLLQNPMAMAPVPGQGGSQPAPDSNGLPSPTIRPPALNAPNQGPSPVGGV